MDVLLDTNIILDVLLDRKPFSEPAARLWTKVEAGELRGGITATSVTNIYYIARKGLGRADAVQAVEKLLRVFEVCPVDGAVLQAALGKSWPDFEDAVQDAAAELAGIPLLVTRDPTGFAGSTRRILDADTLLGELDATP